MIQIITVLFFLLYACCLDLTTRQAPNSLWLAMLAPGSLFTSPNPIPSTLFSFSVMFLLLYPIWKFSQFGGADLKALLSISLLIPTSPAGPYQPFHNIFALSVLCNALLLTLALSPLLKNKKSIPFILSITGGFITAVLFGDIISFINTFL